MQRTPHHKKEHKNDNEKKLPISVDENFFLPLPEKPIEVSKSVGAVVLNAYNHTLLVFQKKNRYWEFPKGKIEPAEREFDTLKREIFEETGISSFAVIPHFHKTMHYDFRYHGRVIRRKVVYYLIKTHEKVRISSEHLRYCWLPIEKAKVRVKHRNHVLLLEQVEKRIQQGGL